MTDTHPGPARGPHPAIIAAGIIGALALFRLWLCAQYPLSPDESYYWLWSKHLDWCYYSKGPMVAWAIAMGTGLAGDTEFGVRWPAVLLGTATAWLVFDLARRLYGPAAALRTLAILCVIPLMAVGSVLMTIDPLSVFFWAAGACATWRASRDNSPLWWAVAGACVGLGFMAKFTNAVQGVCIGLFLLAHARGRAQLATPWPWVGALVAAAVPAPVWIWNATHGWITFVHTAHRAGFAKHQTYFQIDLGEFAGFILLQALVYSPLLWAGMIAAAARGSTLARDDERPLFLLAHFVPLLGLFAAFALNDSGQPNWTVPGHLTAIILLAALWPAMATERPRLRPLAAAAMALALAMTLALHDTRWMWSAAGVVMTPKQVADRLPALDPLNRLRGWAEAGRQIEQTRAKLGARMVICDHYQMASALAWHAPGYRNRTRPFIPHNPDMIQNQYDFWPDYRDMTGSDALFVTTQKGTPRTLRAEFAEVWTLDGPDGDPFYLVDGGLPVMRLRFFYCRSYLGRTAQRRILDSGVVPDVRKGWR